MQVPTKNTQMEESPNILDIDVRSQHYCLRDDKLTLRFEHIEDTDGPDYDFESTLVIARGEPFLTMPFSCKTRTLEEFRDSLHKMLIEPHPTIIFEAFKFDIRFVPLGHHPTSLLTAVCTIGHSSDRNYRILRGFVWNRVEISKTIREITMFLKRCKLVEERLFQEQMQRLNRRG